MTRCLDANKNLNIQIVNDSVEISPCCLHSTHPVTTIDFTNDITLSKIRNQFDQNEWPAVCAEKCLTQEKLGKSSRRQGSNQWYKDNGLDNNDVELIRLDYWTGDICNLKCAICGPNNSSAWKEELKIPIIERKATINQTWNDLDLTKLQFIHFNGGEPLLSKEHVSFLESIPNPATVHINYNTNGTIRPTKHLIELWSKFKLVLLDFSIDDIGERFEYQRYPAKWDQVTENLQWYIDTMPVNCMFAVNTTVGVLNESNLDSLNLWLQQNFSHNRVTDPIDHRQQPCNGIFTTSNTDWNMVVKNLNELDLRRGISWRDTFPELNQKIQAYNL
jgi:sulfatase maturation enzyme AslB (radical SAM superfamily)